jgi:hypothetical protein
VRQNKGPILVGFGHRAAAQLLSRPNPAPPHLPLSMSTEAVEVRYKVGVMLWNTGVTGLAEPTSDGKGP